MIRDYIRLIRIKHWIKDVFILAPLLFSLNFFKPSFIGRTLLMCAAFCLAASGVYAFNDAMDRDRDRMHPKKRTRPVASGAIPVRNALVLAGTLFLGALLVCMPLGPAAVGVILAYSAMNVAYTLLLKNQIFIDVMVIAVGFLLRVIAGGLAIDVELSRWMLLTTFFLSLFLGFGKRRKEMLVTAGSTRHRLVFQEYSVDLLNCLIIVTASLTIITYALYVVSAQTLVSLGGSKFVATVPFVVFGVFRYLFLIYNQKNGGDPAEVLLKDRALLIDVGLWVLTVCTLIGYATLAGGQA